MIERKLTHLLSDRIEKTPAVVLLGPRQCGKSTLAKFYLESLQEGVYIDLERPSDRKKLEEAEAYLERLSHEIVCLDEVQRAPELFTTLRSLIDADRRPGRFFLLGSASRDLIQQSSESLAGRVSFLELTPLVLDEVGTESLEQLWLRGGFPPSYLAESDEASLEWRFDFVSSFLERDLPQLGFGYPAENMRRFWTMCAHLQGQAFNGSQLGASLGVSHHTARAYAELLTQTFVLRLLRPFEANVRKRLVKTPKLYIRDTGLLHTLLSIECFDDLYGHPVFGASWEGLVVESIASRLKPSVTASYCRTASGDEIDLVLQKGDKTIAIECKASKSPSLTPGNIRALEVVKAETSYLVAPVEERFPMSNGWEAIDLSGLTCELKERGWLLY